MTKILISAGEVSGDLHAANLVSALKRLDPSLRFFGLGSEKMASVGVDVLFDISRCASVGLTESLPGFFPVYQTYRQTVNLLKQERPDVFLAVDSQGINLPLCFAAKKLGLKTVYYISPQEWLWGTPRGVKKVISAVDLIVAIFEKEYETYKRAGGNVVYFGHPLLDLASSPLSRAAARHRYLGNNYDDKKPLIALCPGSRRQELQNLLPIFVRTAAIIKHSLPDVDFIMPVASSYALSKISSFLPQPPLRIIQGNTYEILTACDLAICASGTINLEASLLGVPNIMAYKLSPLSYFIGKYFLKIPDKLPYFSMPNLLLNKPTLPEFLRGEARPEKIAPVAIALLQDQTMRNSMLADFVELKKLLGSPGAVAHCAAAILNFIKQTACR